MDFDKRYLGAFAKDGVGIPEPIEGFNKTPSEFYRCVDEALKKIQQLEERNEELETKLHRIDNWCKAYPLDIFPEPDLKKVAKVLKENGMTLGSVSAHAMRHVLKGIQDIINEKG
jgi:hypothetical protein